jgi:hypothetical protein
MVSVVIAFHGMLTEYVADWRLHQALALRSGLPLFKSKANIIPQLKVFGSGNARGKAIASVRPSLLGKLKDYSIQTMRYMCMLMQIMYKLC